MNKDWWKWGSPEEFKHINDYPKAKAYLEDLWKTNFKHEYTPPNKFNIEPITDKKKETIKDIFGKISAKKISFKDEDRLKTALGKSYYDVIRICKDNNIVAPDAVLSPTTHEEIEYILKQANDNLIKIVPVGGATNVVGALTMTTQQLKSTISCAINLLNYKKLIHIDHEHYTATFQAGILGPELEKILNEQGYTLGHFPQSFEYSTLGGWLVTRSAGQESSYYGKIEDIVEQVRVVTPIGTLHSNDYTHDASGINLLQLFAGSEGVFGVVSEVKIKIKKLPSSYRWVTALFPNFEAGTKFLQDLSHNEIKPSVVRLSDAKETMLFSKLSNEHTAPTRLDNIKKEIQKYILKWKNLEEPCVLIMRFVQNKYSISAPIMFVKNSIEKFGGMVAPSVIGEKWAENRFKTPYLRDTFVEHGIFIDTMETLVHWKDANIMHLALTNVLKKSKAFNKEQGIFLAHISHIYPSAACMYFTLLTPMHRGAEIEQWKEIKDLVTNTIMQYNGTVSHHHSVGMDHKKWYLKATDPVALTILQSIKKIIDPNGIMNPGKLFT